MKLLPNLLAIFSVLLISCLHGSVGAVVDQNGGYTVTIAIRSGEDKPDNLDAYINNIKNTISTLSLQMWIATQNSFFVRDLDIVAPQSWNLSATATTKSFATADIRMSSTTKSPRVENPNLCGMPGDFMELPISLFNTAHSGRYGEHWKVLLVQWAQYRWGVHEEHGIPGDKRFPYFTKNVNDKDTEPKWQLNGCTNAQDNKLMGVYQRLNETACDPMSDSDLDVQCRFYPDKNENAEVTSSLMHFHFMESVTQFCDSSTHQKHVPTKQNLYCDNKSVMEIVESTPDFKSIQEKSNSVPALKTTLLSAASRPALYILLDNGIADNDDAVLINKVVLEFGKFIAGIDSNLHNDLIVGVAQYPAADNGLFAQEVVPLGFLKDNRELVIQAIGNRKVVNNANGDFGLALQHIAAAIRARSPSEGGNILFLKTTGAKNTTNFSQEADVEIALRDSKIRLFGLEIIDQDRARQNLANIAEGTKGDAIAISHADDVGEQIPLDVSTWLNHVVLPKYAELPETSNLERVVFSQEVRPSKTYDIPVPANTELLKFVLSVPGSLGSEESVEAGIITPEVAIRTNFTEGRDYGKNRYLYTGRLDTSAWMLNEVSFKYPGNQNGRLTVISSGTALPADVSVTIHTSASDNILDYSSIQNPNAPFVLTAVVRQGTQPVIGARVIATIENGVQTMQVPLLDTTPGLSNDVGDGVYSDIVLLPENGKYAVTVTVTKDNEANFEAVTMSSSSLIPPDQDFEVIESVVFPTGLTKVVTFGFDILVTNADTFVPAVQKIRDLSVSVADARPNEMIFTFFTPRVFNLQNSNSTPMVYTFYSSEDPDLLTNLDVKNIPAGVNVAFTATGGDALGSVKTITVSSPRDTYTYYVVVGWSSTVYYSLPSNIVGVAETVAQVTTTAGTSTTEATSTGGSSETSGSSGYTSTTTTTGNTASESNTETTGFTGSEGETSSTEPTYGSSSTTGLSDGTTTKTTTKATTTSKPAGSKPWRRTTAGILIIIAIFFACLLTLGVAFWYFRKRRASKVARFSVS